MNESPNSPFALTNETALRRPRLLRMLHLWMGLQAQVGQFQYFVSGLGWMAVKYLTEAFVIALFTGGILMPWQFLNPLVSMRMKMLEGAPPWLSVALLVWTLPFLWIAVSMSVRRAVDAGMSPWFGMLVLVPFVNLIVMIALSLARTAPAEVSRRTHTMEGTYNPWNPPTAVAASLLVGAMMILVSVVAMNSYGASLFLGTPVLMSATAAYLHNLRQPASVVSSIGVGVASVIFGGVGMLLFALEGAICIAMAMPLMLPLGVLGGLIGKMIAEGTRRPVRDLMGAIIFLPLLATGERWLVGPTVREVVTAVEIGGPPETVWRNVIQFPELPAAKEWYFQLGIASPQRARIEGVGVGATRYCEFTTGTFVEPITVWDPPTQLAFDVTDQPAPMFELSPYRHVHPPHLDGAMQSHRGEFRLVRLANLRTRLEGRTWYSIDMFPQSYWAIWSDAIVHRIHLRVLGHIRGLSESDQLRRQTPHRGKDSPN